ncbi:hypothetical protein [Halomonas sp.]|uniref:hypothetical protein n=1 Tax=Halomonas sp. TaxID=1486246 RepID=UPI003A9107B4
MSISSQSPVFVASSFSLDDRDTSQGQNNNHFAGIAYTSDAIILGKEGLAQYLEKHDTETFRRSVVDGRFYAFLEMADEYRAFVDPLSQDTLYYYFSNEKGPSGDGNWAVSNSLLGLAEFLYGKIKLTQYRPALLSFFIGKGSGIGAQPISSRTVFSEIRALPLGKTLVIDKKSQISRLEGSPASITRPFEGVSYDELVLSVLIEGASRLRAMREHGINFAADLTGGHDSRACFGLLSRAFNDWDKVRLISNPRKDEDYRIATSLAARYGGKLHSNSGKSVSIDPNNAYSIWKQGSIGTYLPVYFPLSSFLSPREYKINGGMILAKEFAAQKPSEFLESLRSIYSRDTDYQLVSNEFSSALNELEVGDGDEKAMDWFYLASRARYHYGRSWYTSLAFPIISPLINPKTFAASLKLSRNELNEGKLSLDILMALDPVLALHPFDSAEKSFSSEMILQSSFWKANRTTALKVLPSQSYKVFSASLSPQEKSEMTNEKAAHDSCLRDIEKDLMFFSKESSLVNELFSKPMLDRALKEIRSKGKLSSRSRLATHIITCGMVEKLTC